VVVSEINFFDVAIWVFFAFLRPFSHFDALFAVQRFPPPPPPLYHWCFALALAGRHFLKSFIRSRRTDVFFFARSLPPCACSVCRVSLILPFSWFPVYPPLRPNHASGFQVVFCLCLIVLFASVTPIVATFRLNLLFSPCSIWTLGVGAFVFFYVLLPHPGDDQALLVINVSFSFSPVFRLFFFYAWFRPHFFPCIDCSTDTRSRLYSLSFPFLRYGFAVTPTCCNPN